MVSQSDHEPRLPLRLVVSRTGLKPETIRAWERRYGAVHPARTPGGTRMFSEEDVARLLHLKALRDRGRGLTSIAQLPTERLAEMVSAERERAPELPQKAPPDSSLTPMRGRKQFTTLSPFGATWAEKCASSASV